VDVTKMDFGLNLTCCEIIFYLGIFFLFFFVVLQFGIDCYLQLEWHLYHIVGCWCS